MRKRIFKSILWLILVGGCVLNPHVSGADFEAGSGTKSDPWQIKNRQQLSMLTNYVGELSSGRYFQLAGNIVFLESDFTEGGEYYNAGRGWNPVGNDRGENTAFKGNFDGNGYVIYNLKINRPQSQNVGLFGYLENAVIENLRVESLNFTGSTNVGGLAGLSKNSSISNCYTSGSLVGQKNTGGLVGYSEGTDFYRDGADTEVESSLFSQGLAEANAAGGLIAYAEGGAILECYARGNVEARTTTDMGGSSAFAYAGGLVGYLRGITLDRCFAEGKVRTVSTSDVRTGDAYSGGLVGYLYLAGVQNSYSSGDVVADTRLTEETLSAGSSGRSYVGGLVGFGVTSTVLRSYAEGGGDSYSGAGGGYAGGIIGASSFSAVENSVGNNTFLRVETESPNSSGVGRLSGVFTGTLTNNLALDSMTLSMNGVGVPPADDRNHKDGGSTSEELLRSAETYEELGWDFESIFQIENQEFPSLVWEDEIFVTEIPTITLQSESQKVNEGDTVRLEVSALGGRLIYLWTLDNQLLPDQNEAVLIIENFQTKDSGIYQVCVFNDKGEVWSQPILVTLNDEPVVPEVILTNPELIVEEGVEYFIFNVEGVDLFKIEGLIGEQLRGK